MKVKELIEQLQKQDPEDEIHIWVDNEVGCGADLYGRYNANDIGIMGHDIYYQNEDGEIKNFAEIEEDIYNEYEDINEYDIKKEAVKLTNDMQKLEGCWIYIQP